MGIKCGIVGLPNVGKSSLFNILSEGKAEAANYPFCTIEPNVGVVMVPDPRLDQLSAINNPEETIPSIVEFVDCLLYTSPSPRDQRGSRMPSSA